MVKKIGTKTIPMKRVYRFIGNTSRGGWYEGRFYEPLKNIKKTSRDKIVKAIQLGTTRTTLYTLDKTRRVKGFAPKNLL